MGRLDGKVALVTGAARGQGRSHAVSLAAEGADVIVTDICGPVASSFAPPATRVELDETAEQITALGRKVHVATADVRDDERMVAVVRDGVADLGRLDVVCANAGIVSYVRSHELTPAEWRETLDVNLTGVWNTCRAVVPVLLEQGDGGSIILTSSAVALKPSANMAHYVASKAGVVGLMKTMAIELGPEGIRVNTVNPGAVNTAMIHNEPTYRLFAPDLDLGAQDVFEERASTLSILPGAWAEPADVSHAVVFLASDDSRMVTGISMAVDGGQILL